MLKKVFIELNNISNAIKPLEKYMKIQLNISLPKFLLIYACSKEYSHRE